MKESHILAAKREAQRFIEAVETLEQRVATDPYFARHYGITGSRETASVRRASMDLTRSLATMRKP